VLNHAESVDALMPFLSEKSTILPNLKINTVADEAGRSSG